MVARNCAGEGGGEEYVNWSAVLPMAILVGLVAVGALAADINEASKRNKKRADADRRWRQWRHP